MEYTILLALLVIVLTLSTPGFCDDKRSIFRQRAKNIWRDLAKKLGGGKRTGARVRGNLEIVGPLGGVLEAKLDSGLTREGGLFAADTRGHLEAGVRTTGPLGKVNGVGGAIEGGFSRDFTSVGADVAGRVDFVDGHVLTGVRRSGAAGELTIGAGSSRLGRSRLGSSGVGYTSGLLGTVLADRCGYLPPACRAIDPRERGVIVQYVFDDRLYRCVQEYVFYQCARRGIENNIYSSMRECLSQCS